ncbi:unnamed protein product [Ectocarpus sp. 8 AP-2014]
MGLPVATHDPDANSGSPASRCWCLRLPPGATPPDSDMTVKKTTVQKPRRRQDFRQTHNKWYYYCTRTHRILPQCTTTRNNGWSARRLLSTAPTPTNQHSNRRAREGAARQGEAPRMSYISSGSQNGKTASFAVCVLVLPPGRLSRFLLRARARATSLCPSLPPIDANPLLAHLWVSSCLIQVQ